jgi:LacI family transcriptional regulator
MYSNPPLSTVHQSAFELGQLAALAMLQLLAAEPLSVEVPQPRLISRESCRRLTL